ncbi:TPA: hypothetical protein TVB68_000892 [Streptococcus equi subsp. ruminatorum]|nr:hypothetical protein [Streptococcus equi subsp. ruminatorum]
MYYYLAILIFIIIFTWLEFAERRDNFKDSLSLRKEFESWIIDSDNNKRPSNALFSDLYQKCYQKRHHAKAVHKGNRALLISEQADIVSSFPTTHPQLVLEELSILDNLVDYFELEYRKMKSVKSLVTYAISLPIRLSNCLGINSDPNSKSAKAIAWVVTLILPELKELLIRFIIFLFKEK